MFKAIDRLGLTALLATVLVLSVLGPYITAGVRMEQLAVYAMAFLLLPRLLNSKFRTGTGAITYLWFSLAVVSIAATLVYSGGSFIDGLGGVDALTLPLAVMIVAVVAGSSEDRDRILVVVQKGTVYCLAANAVLSMSMLIFPAVPKFVERYYWSAGSGLEDSIAVQVFGIGRIVGVFHSPFAAGCAYSVALIILVYLICAERTGVVAGGVLLTLLLAGGFITQSKMFLFVGLPLAAALFLLSGAITSKIIASLSCAVAALFLLASQAADWTTGAVGRLTLLQDMSSGLTDFVTAGRLASGSDVGNVASKVLEQSPVFGLGAFGASLGPLDTSWTEMIARAGLVGATCLVFMLVLVGYRIAAAYPLGGRLGLLLATALLILWMAATFGGPTLSANRFGTLLILNLWLVVSAISNGNRRQRKESGYRAKLVGESAGANVF